MQIKFDEVSYVYRSPLMQVAALEGVNFELKTSKFYGIVGHTGSGKSTFIQHLNILLQPTSGKITLNELEIGSETKIKQINKVRKNIGIVMQFSENQLFEETVEKDILFGPNNFGIANINPAFFLDLVGLDESFLEKIPFELSGGQMRRVAIAGVLAYNPKVLILDEPTVGLDPQGKKQIMEMLKKLHKSGITVIIITHEMENIYEYCQHVLAFEKGKLIFDDEITAFVENKKMNELFSSPTLEFKKQLEEALNYEFSAYKFEDLVKEVKAYYG